MHDIHAWIIRGSFKDNLGIISGSFGTALGIVRRSCEHHLQSSGDRLGIVWDGFWNVLGVADRCGIMSDRC